MNIWQRIVSYFDISNVPKCDEDSPPQSKPVFNPALGWNVGNTMEEVSRCCSTPPHKVELNNGWGRTTWWVRGGLIYFNNGKCSGYYTTSGSDKLDGLGNPCNVPPYAKMPM